MRKRTIPKYKKTVWGNVSKYVRKKHEFEDGAHYCISCLKRINGAVHAGHWIAKGNGVHEAVRFDERNLWTQCYYCNCKLDGNTVFYTEHLKEYWPEQTTEDVKRCSKIKVKWDLDILKWINRRALNNLKRLEKGIDTKMITWYTISNAWEKMKQGIKVEP